MKICFVCVEIFAWGKHGGFGRATRTIGREMSKRGHEVYAIVPRRKGQHRYEELDGIKVYGISPWKPLETIRIIKKINPEICHSCEPSLLTYFAMRALPDARHMVTFRDPRDLKDWWIEFTKPSLNHLQVLYNYYFENNYLVHRSVRKMDAIYTIGNYLIPKVKRIYHLQEEPIFLPTPVGIPSKITKSEKPLVSYIARLDRRKRPELFFKLAAKFPNIKFVVLGKSRNPSYELKLIKHYGVLPNLEILGFVDQFSDPKHHEILEKSWVLVNTAAREALPNSFIEALAHGCAILSEVNPDNIAFKFGYHAKNGDFSEGLHYLLEKDNWKVHGRLGYEYARNTFEVSYAVDLHERIYKDLLEK